LKILYVAHRIPFPPNKGDKIRSFNEVRFLARNHEVHRLAFCDRADDLRYRDALLPYCRSVTLIPLVPWIQKLKSAGAVLRGQPLTLGYFGSRIMRQTVRKKLAEGGIDVVFAYSSSMSQYADHAQAMPKVLDLVDSDAAKWQQYAAAKKAPVRWLYSYEASRLKHFEIDMLDRFDACLFVSSREAQNLPPDRCFSTVAFVQNGIDLDYYKPIVRQPSDSIVFTGAMDYFPNIDAVTYFATEIMPLIRRRFSASQFLIVGSRPTRQVKKLATLPGVVVTGEVPDVRPFIARAHVAVAPLRISQGVQNKILEALATGLRVVTTTAAESGLACIEDLPLLVANDAQSFAECVCDCLRQPPLTIQQVERCRKLLREHYDWDSNLNTLETLLRSLKAKHGKPAAAVASA
jgi:sugar transferase (PEP-CTERM/EpsH1 system associated)